MNESNTTDDRPRWYKSSFSNGQSACVEVAAGVPGAVPVRDSKATEGPVIVHGAAAWTSFVSAFKADHPPM
ncbi:DUF397 domain-containing protein [Streptomyces sp. NPDC003717]|uniref:DUF397 domain-containing protein n=1 Tax=Streptomyces sp. NPDC003717 TaxID=3154276 RepID=UPI0033BB5435